MNFNVIKNWTAAEREMVRKRLPRTWADICSAMGRESSAAMDAADSQALTLDPYLRFDRRRHHDVLITRLRRQAAVHVVALRKPNITGRVLALCARYYGISPESVIGHGRSPEITKARHAAASVIAKLKPGWGPAMIGRQLGRDHSTICNALKKARKNPEKFAEVIAYVEVRLQ